MFFWISAYLRTVYTFAQNKIIHKRIHKYLQYLQSYDFSILYLTYWHILNIYISKRVPFRCMPYKTFGVSVNSLWSITRLKARDAILSDATILNCLPDGSLMSSAYSIWEIKKQKRHQSWVLPLVDFNSSIFK